MRITRKDFLKSSAALGATVLTGVALHGTDAEAGPPVLRPPGALDEDDFLQTCIRCQRCADACRNQCITAFTPGNGKQFSLTPSSGEAGTPVIFPRRQACNLCLGEDTEVLLCTAACPSGALQVVPKTPEVIQEKVAMGKAVLDKNLCFSYTGSSCGVCTRACPFEGKALKAGFFERPVLDADYCVGCGLCERACIRYPQAITVIPASADGKAQ